MPWDSLWNHQSKKDKQATARREKDQLEAIAALKRGDLPLVAKQRIIKHRSRNGEFFSSDLSVNEFLQLKEAGVEPISQVMGTSFFNTVYVSTTGRNLTGEIQNLTEAQSMSRLLAVKRMQLEAKLLGASGVVGVQVKTRRPNMGQPHTEFTAYGTAIKIADYPAAAEPFTSNLSGQEFWQLYKAGFYPTEFIMGCSLYYVVTDPNTSNQRNAGVFKSAPNQEVTRYTKGCYAARRKAMDRFEAELIASGADGAVGVEVNIHLQGIDYEAGQFQQQDVLVHFRVTGTAIKSGKPVATPRAPLMYLDLRDRKKTGAKIELKEFVPKKH